MAQRGEELACQGRNRRRLGFNPWVGKIPWRRKWQPTPLFLPGESQGQRSPAGSIPKGWKESDTTEHICTHTHTHTHTLMHIYFPPPHLPDQGLNPCSLHWKCRILTTGPQRSSLKYTHYTYTHTHTPLSGRSLHLLNCSITLMSALELEHFTSN